jgi:hypothetical protein
MLCPALGAPTSQQVAGYERRLKSHQDDLIVIARNVRDRDAEIAINLIELAHLYSVELAHVQDLLLIDSLIQGEADRRRVKTVTGARIKSVADGIDLSIKKVNLGLARLNSQAVVTTATKIRDDLRALKELLLSSD